MRLFQLLCVLGLCTVAVAAQQDSSTKSSAQPAPSLADARQLVAKGQFDKALEELNALAAQRPEPGGVERLLGFVYYQQNKMAEAEATFARAVDQDANDTESMQMRGVALFRLGKPAEAIPLLEKAHIAVASSNIDPNYVLGLCYMEVRRYDDGRKAFSAQYGFAPDSAPAYLLAGRMTFRHEYLPVAEEFVHKALALNPNLPMAYMLLGEIGLAKGDIPGAIGAFEKERMLNPLFGGVYDRLGDAYLRQGEYDKAQAALVEAVVLEPDASGPYILLGNVLLRQQNPVMAAMYLERAAHMDPGNSMTHSLLGQAYREVGRIEDAKREFQSAAQIQAANRPKLESIH
jgi:tetratricopeptide (TPR) repeat protein